MFVFGGVFLVSFVFGFFVCFFLLFVVVFVEFFFGLLVEGLLVIFVVFQGFSNAVDMVFDFPSISPNQSYVCVRICVCIYIYNFFLF